MPSSAENKNPSTAECSSGELGVADAMVKPDAVTVHEPVCSSSGSTYTPPARERDAATQAHQHSELDAYTPSPSTSSRYVPLQRDSCASINPTQIAGTVVDANDVGVGGVDGCSPTELPGSRCHQSTNGPQKPLHDLWPGKNRFFCGGTFVTGGENDISCCPSFAAPNFCAWLCILLPSSVYFIFAFVPIWKSLTPALPILTTFLFLITVGSLLGACCTDPGMLPRRDVVLATQERANLQECLGFDLLGLTGNGQLEDLTPSQIEALIPKELSDKGYRWCSTCKIIRPPRSSHCSACDNCVMRFDHHCPFVNNCVGQRNYHYFFAFTSSVGVLALFVLPSLGWYFITTGGEESSNSGWPSLQYVVYAILGIVGLAALALVALWTYHTFLVCTGQTTKEHLKGKRASGLDRDPTLCAKRGPQLFNPRALVTEGDFLRKKRPLWGKNRRRYGDEYFDVTCSV